MKEHRITIILTLSLLITLLLGSTYAYLIIGSTSDNEISGEAGCFDIEYNGHIGTYSSNNDTLEPSETYSVPYENNTGFAYVTLSKSEDCEIYNEVNIKLKTNNIKSTSNNSNDYTSRTLLTEGALKYRVVDSSNTSNYWEGTITTTDTTIETLDTTLASSVPLTNTATTYNIYIWIDSAITSNSNIIYDGLKYSGSIYVDAAQSSTYTG